MFRSLSRPDTLRAVAVDDQLGRIPRPAAEIDGVAQLRQGYLRQQVARRARALILEFHILAG